MGFIENQLEFQAFMKKNGPEKSASQSNYLSWLTFISENGFDINRNLKSNDEILDYLKENENLRSKYKSKDAYSDFGSALNKYRSFLDSNFSPVIEDLEEIGTHDITETEKDQLRKARIGQGKYRKELIEIWKKCSVTQFEKLELLIASHILPWKDSTNNQRLDKYNGLLLLPNYDKLFDKGYISFSNDGRIILSSQISHVEYSLLGIDKDSSLYKLHSENIYYLEKHREIHHEKLS